MQHKTYSTNQIAATAGATKVPLGNTRGKKKQEELLQPYFPDPELVNAVNIALLVNRPLLVMGEPGCGKSLLAKDIAFQWYGQAMYTGEKYFEWPVKSTSKAREGLYEFDHLGRLYASNNKLAIAKDPANFVRFGPLAKAMAASSENEKAVLLIDEIDKADIDFSNDLLNELEQNAYTITETGKKVTHNGKPFIVITSNSEKDLSDAFLRRCVFHYIDLFSPSKLAGPTPREWLTRIVKARFFKDKKEDETLISKAIDVFVTVRQQMNSDPLGYRKTVSTSEFLDWFSVLHQCASEKTTDELTNTLKVWLDGGSQAIPFGSALFKTPNALMNFQTTR
jgi:MoxR-like ATPase